MPKFQNGTRAEDSIIDRYVPSAGDAEREEARENLRRLISLLVRVHLRLEAEKSTGPIRDNPHPALESEHPSKPA